MMMTTSNLSQKEIAKKFGCSLSALQLWKREILPKILEEEEEEEWDEETHDQTQEEEIEDSENCRCSKPLAEAGDDSEDVLKLKKSFWAKGSRAVDMLLTPKTASPEEVVDLVNEALEYAHRMAQK